MAASTSGRETRKNFKYAVIGGGIAGVTCVEMLLQLQPEETVLLVTASPLIKTVTNVKQVTEMIQVFDVTEESSSQLEAEYHNVTVVHKEVAAFDHLNKIIHTMEGTDYKYEKLCLCTGAAPKMISHDSPYVLGIRDTETVKMFQKRLINARRVIVVGNGGIATELVYQIEGCEVVWAIKDASINCVFLDDGASKFLVPRLNEPKQRESGPVKRLTYTLQAGSKDASQPSGSGLAMGSALGPDWSVKLPIHGAESESHRVTVEYSVEVVQLMSALELEKAKETTKVPLCIHDEFSKRVWPVYVLLSNNIVYGCDFVVSATGVQPCTNVFTENCQFDLAEDGGIKVNTKMQTSVNDVYAAGDVCTTSWEPAPHWLQMRLWVQARQMGAYAAQCMVADCGGEDIDLDICFELFAHVTKFFRYKVVLLGRFNAQDIGSDYEIQMRVTEGVEYVKVILKDNRIQGAILIGETDLEEVFENLILNQTDLTNLKDYLLDPNVDIEDYFD